MTVQRSRSGADDAYPPPTAKTWRKVPVDQVAWVGLGIAVVVGGAAVFKAFLKEIPEVARLAGNAIDSVRELRERWKAPRVEDRERADVDDTGSMGGRGLDPRD